MALWMERTTAHWEASPLIHKFGKEETTQMIDPNVVKLAVEYLDQCCGENTPATLVGMHWFIDGRNKTLPLLEEINEALHQRPSVCVERTNGVVFFVTSGTEHVVTKEDMKLADRGYRKEFTAALREMK
jgi:hypothetical protein